MPGFLAINQMMIKSIEPLYLYYFWISFVSMMHLHILYTCGSMCYLTSSSWFWSCWWSKLDLLLLWLLSLHFGLPCSSWILHDSSLLTMSPWSQAWLQLDGLELLDIDFLWSFPLWLARWDFCCGCSWLVLGLVGCKWNVCEGCWLCSRGKYYPGDRLSPLFICTLRSDPLHLGNVLVVKYLLPTVLSSQPFGFTFPLSLLCFISGFRRWSRFSIGFVFPCFRT